MSNITFSPEVPDHNHALVARLAKSYRDAADRGEALETAIADLIADLLHYADTLPEEERDFSDEATLIGETVADKALINYLDEVEETSV